MALPTLTESVQRLMYPLMAHRPAAIETSDFRNMALPDLIAILKLLPAAEQAEVAKGCGWDDGALSREQERADNTERRVSSLESTIAEAKKVLWGGGDQGLVQRAQHTVNEAKRATARAESAKRELLEGIAALGAVEVALASMTKERDAAIRNLTASVDQCQAIAEETEPGVESSPAWPLHEPSIPELEGRIRTLEEQLADKRSGCPCRHTTPCNPKCTCMNPGSSRGCARCCSYGSPEQQKAAAEYLTGEQGRLEAAERTAFHRGARAQAVSDAQLFEATTMPSTVPFEPSTRVGAQPVREYHGEVWGYSSTENPDVWDGACVSRDDAIEKGRANYGADDPFWIVEGQWLEVADFFDADDVIEAAKTQVYDNAHEDAELDIREGGKEALNALLTAWAEKYAVLRSWTAVGDAQKISPIESVETECAEHAHGEEPRE